MAEKKDKRLAFRVSDELFEMFEAQMDEHGAKTQAAMFEIAVRQLNESAEPGEVEAPTVEPVVPQRTAQFDYGTWQLLEKQAAGWGLGVEEMLIMAVDAWDATEKAKAHIAAAVAPAASGGMAPVGSRPVIASDLPRRETRAEEEARLRRERAANLDPIQDESIDRSDEFVSG